MTDERDSLVTRAKNLLMTNPDVVREMEYSSDECDRRVARNIKKLAGVL